MWLYRPPTMLFSPTCPLTLSFPFHLLANTRQYMYCSIVRVPIAYLFYTKPLVSLIAPYAPFVIVVIWVLRSLLLSPRFK